MTKITKIIYWVATIWLALGMLSTGIVQLIKTKEEVIMMTHLGYPLYFLTIIGAVLSHLALGDVAIDFFGPVLLLVLTCVSWYLKQSYYPSSAKNLSNNNTP